MIGAQSDSIETGAGGTESVAKERSGSLTIRLSCKVRSMFGSIAAEGKALSGGVHPPVHGRHKWLRIEGRSGCLCDLLNTV